MNKIAQRITKKQTIICLSAIFLLGVLTGGIAIAQTGPASMPIYITSGYYPGAPDYTVFYDGTTYYAKNATGYAAFSSTNKTSVLSSVASASDNGDSVFVVNGVLGPKSCRLVVGTAGAGLSAGEVVYESSIGTYGKADASANTTIGYGFVWLNAIDAASSGKCLLVEEGDFTLASWTWTGGLLWVSTSAGAVTETNPSSAGNQLCVVGRVLNATTISYSNPKGQYGEHA